MNPWSGGEVPLSLWGKKVENVSSCSAAVCLLTPARGCGNIPGIAEMCYAGETTCGNDIGHKCNTTLSLLSWLCLKDFQVLGLL